MDSDLDSMNILQSISQNTIKQISIINESMMRDEKQFWGQWKTITKKSPDEIQLDLKKIESFHPFNKFTKRYLLKTYAIPHMISSAILSYLPIRYNSKEEFIANFDISVNITQKAWALINNRTRENIYRFICITGCKDIENIWNENDIGFQVLQECILDVYWFRFGTERISPLYPYQPSDILGILMNHKWFYYKDGHPNWVRNESAHQQWQCLVADDLRSLLAMMDFRDVNDFVHNEIHWRPLNLKRCGCQHCIDIHQKLNEYEYADGDGTEDMRRAFLKKDGQVTVKKRYPQESKCCGCIIL